MNVSDLILDFLVARKVSHIFMMTGGHVSFLLDRLSARDDIGYVCVAHEQAGAMAADGFSRMRPESIGVAIATSGPGAANMLTGIGCSWFDSIPALFITGQVNTYESRGERQVRQIGFQEMDIIGMARPITKWAATLDAPENILLYLEKAVHIAKSGRPGPVLLDIPMNFQRQDVDPASLPHYVPEEEPSPAGADIASQVAATVELLRRARRPALLAGGGVRNASATGELRRLAERAQAPVCLSMNGIDAFPHDHPNYGGFIGVYGNRGGNFTLANCDLLLAVGTRLDSRQTGVDTSKFARFAKKVVVDVDPCELGARFAPDVAVSCDAKVFLKAVLEQLPPAQDRGDWLGQVARWREKYPPCPPECRGSQDINPYEFLEVLSSRLGPRDTVVLDTGQNMVWGTQVLQPRAEMRMWTAGGMSPMGYSFPAAMGASLARPDGRSICLIGDGGMQINVQELETVRRLNPPLSVIVINNNSLGLIRQFQDDYLGSRHVGATDRNGYTAPDFVRVAEAYGLPALRITRREEVEAGVEKALRTAGPMLLDVRIPGGCNVIPKALMQHPMEDQYPYIPLDEFLEQMIVEPLDPGTYRIGS
ncbi:thiamine pyrophosphate-binding protein [Desulfovibrio aminophilus]|nr:thiamine pyrophosphate-binding protein [Desulfovibrio aminophilus]MCM0756027.1 thiamine pyrophosphate-binding protein [Desulfovibrio aminophilus]